MPDDPEAVRLSSEPGAAAADIAAVGDRIDAWNMDVTGVRDYRQVAIFLRDEAGGIRGGVTGGVWGGWLHVVSLWVDEDLRGRGLGRDLLLAAEAEARAAGARGAFLRDAFVPGAGALPAPRLRGDRGDRGLPPGASQLVMRKSLA